MQPQGSLISILIWSYRVLYSLSQTTFHAGNGMAKIPLDTLLRQQAKLHFFYFFLLRSVLHRFANPALIQNPCPVEKSGKKISGLPNGTIRGLQIGAREITTWGSFRDFKSGQGFQIRTKRFQIGSSHLSKQLSIQFY